MEIFPQLVANSIVAGATYALLALGFNLIYGTTKFFNFAHGVVAIIGGYAAFFLTKALGVPLLFAAAVGILTSGIVGWGLDKIVYLPLRHRRASGMVLLVVSLGAFTALQAFLATLFTSQFQTFSHLGDFNRIYAVAGAAFTGVQVAIFASGVLITMGIALLLKYTLFGKAIKAVSDDEEVSRIVGINTNQIIGYVFFIGSSIAGLAGILVGLDIGIQPISGLNLFVKGAVSVIIGGVGNLYGGVLGAFLLGFVENFGIWKLAGEWKDAVAFILLIIFLIFRPRGIFSR